MRNKERFGKGPKASTSDTVELNGRSIELALAVDKARKAGRRILNGVAAPIRIFDRGFGSLQRRVEATMDID